MQQFSLTFLVITLVALFVAEFSNGQPTDCTKNGDIKNGDEYHTYKVLPWRRCAGRTGCIHFLDRCDYVVTPGLGAHKLHKRKVTWNEARKICMAEGAHLAVLDSEEKETMFYEWMDEKSLNGFWLGFHDLFEEGSWTTITGQFVDTLDSDRWAESHPSMTNKENHCGLLERKYGGSGGAITEKCNDQHSFVCEINLCSALNPLTVSDGKLGN